MAKNAHGAWQGWVTHTATQPVPRFDWLSRELTAVQAGAEARRELFKSRGFSCT